MAKSRSRFWPWLIGVVTVVLVIIALPQSARQWAPGPLRTAGLHFGLDLAGGTQLDFRISEEELRAQMAATEQALETARQGADQDTINRLEAELVALQTQQQNLIEAIRTVLERRINALGVSEALITPSYFGNEKHLLVECPGVVDVQQCIDTVGKTIALEFKEEFTETTAEFEAEVRAAAAAAQRRITESGETLAVLGQDVGDQLGRFYTENGQFYRDTLPKGLEEVWNRSPAAGVGLFEGSISSTVQQPDGSIEFIDIPGLFLLEVTAPRSMSGRVLNQADTAFTYLAENDDALEFLLHTDRVLDDTVPLQVSAALKAMFGGETKAMTDLGDGTARILHLRQRTSGGERMAASHILIAYKGAQAADASVTRTREEAQALAAAAAARVRGGEDFVTVAREVSDGPSAEDGGNLGEFGRGEMVPAFEAAAYALEQGAVSDPVETPFGFHVIRSNRAPTPEPDRATYDELIVRGEAAAAKATDIFTRLQNNQVTRPEELANVRFIFFSLKPTGWKDTPLDGKHFRSATVTTDGISGIPVVQITFDEEGGQMFAELTKRNVGKQLAIFVGGELVSAPVVQGEITGGTAVITGSANFQEAQRLAQDLNTGAIPAPIYLSGQRTVEATLGAEALQMSLWAALVGFILLSIFMIFSYRLLGIVATLALLVYTFLFIVFLKLPLFLVTSQYTVLTLAGVAGIILSIGMAIDANVLIFERMKEELKKGKELETAMNIGFTKAWPSIRDGNVSTIITCLILIFIGTSIVRGFAVALITGIPMSMFTAIVVVRWILRWIIKTPLGKNLKLFSA